ncbi:hypothetical protein AB0C29_00585 [Actinoplanes sp. NPDC048791]|uniref:hypothetical protein n=1 Tax=Actinoplanes sp. NPDC048791 TaxID=3154623 RepID=UPI0033C618D1
MQARKFPLVPAVAITAVLILAVTLLLTRGLGDALLMIAAVALLAGMYLLRRYARAQTIYHRAGDPAASGHREAPPPDPHDRGVRTSIGNREGAA